jgi:hypothetical protein
MKMFRSASLGDWVALALLVGTILLFTVSANTTAKANSAGVKENKQNLKIVTDKVEAMGDSVLALKLTNRADHKELKKTSDNTYKIVKLMAEKQGLIVP